MVDYNEEVMDGLPPSSLGMGAVRMLSYDKVLVGRSSHNVFSWTDRRVHY